MKKKYSGQAAANKFDEVCPAPAAGSTGGWADSFVHISAVQGGGMNSLDKDQRINYEVETGRNGKASAINLSAAD